ncbi:hypothetical protein LOK49_LG02G03814 [Camellia lanceoleosa]|uniref:Uncharacterized protein n=1 Tax=Camellia lanceoleosa TaxID=1840588 RepID=A0ACC0IME2_9ERIC|nr:hypothetical protein LOK49_LG02G03814 [Camellia lanceoleosa]
MFNFSKSKSVHKLLCILKIVIKSSFQVGSYALKSSGLIFEREKVDSLVLFFVHTQPLYPLGNREGKKMRNLIFSARMPCKRWSMNNYLCFSRSGDSS